MSHAGALYKQGSAHAGQVEGPQRGVEIAGSLLLGAALYNPSCAARPDNTGLALMRLASHWDLDLIGHRLSIPVDVNMFSDRQRDGAAKLIPSELDVISGVTRTWGLWRGSALELGTRYERDMPVDHGSYTQPYADARSKLLIDVAQLRPGLEERVARTLCELRIGHALRRVVDDAGDEALGHGHSEAATVRCWTCTTCGCVWRTEVRVSCEDVGPAPT